MKPDITQLKKEAADAGFRPAPFAFLVWNLRRILWPFIRQYHFFQLEKLVETEGRVDRVIDHLDRLAEEIRKLSLGQSDLRGEIAALSGRHNQLGDETERLKGAQGELWGMVRESEARNSALGSQAEQTRSEVASILHNYQGELWGMVRELEARNGALGSQAEQARSEVASILHNYRAILDEIQKFTVAHVELRSDVAALANRQGQLTDEVAGHTDAHADANAALQTVIREFNGRGAPVDELRGDVASITHRQREQSEEISRSAAVQAELWNMVEDLRRNAAGEANTAELRSEITALAGRQDGHGEEIKRSAAAQAELRGVVRELEQRSAAADTKAEELRGQIGGIARLQTEYSEGIKWQGEELGRAAAAQTELRSLVRELDRRSHAIHIKAEELRGEVAAVTSRQSQQWDEFGRSVAAEAELKSIVRELDARSAAINAKAEELRGEVAAVTNRQSEQRDEFGRSAAAGQEQLNSIVRELDGRSAAIHAKAEELRAEVAVLAGQQSQFGDQLGQSSAVQAGLHATIQELDRRGKLFLANTDGGLFLLKSGDLIADYVASNQSWDTHLNPVIEEAAQRKDGLAVDIGAHVGVLSARMARYFQRVISFEPNDFNYRILVANMSINRLTHVQCVNGALFSKPAHLSLGKPSQQEIPLPINGAGSFDGLAASNLGAYSFTEDGTDIFSKAARTLDSYTLNDVALIKVDVQGADGEVIRGAMETIRRCHPIVIFEWEKYLSSKFESSLESVIQLLEEAGYQVDKLKGINEKQTDFVARPLQTVPADTARLVADRFHA